MNIDLENSTLNYLNGGQPVGYIDPLAIYWPRLIAKRLELAQDSQSLNNPYFFVTPSGELRYTDTQNGLSYKVVLTDPQP